MRKDQGYEIARILEEMRSDYWRNLEAVEAGDGADWAEFLVICLADKRYGLPATACREVMKFPHVMRVPRLPAHLPGIFNLRGEIIAVTDLRPLLGLPAQLASERSRLVIVEHAAVRTALLVETVERLVRINTDEVEPLAEGTGSAGRDLISGKVVQGKAVLLLLDLGRIMQRPDMVVDQKAFGQDR